MGELKLDRYTYEDYLGIDKTLKEGERIELIDGEIYFMAGASAEHQDIVGDIFFIIKQKAKEGGIKCFPRVAPYDVKLFNGKEKNVVQPDIMIFCGDAELPCALFEVLSPSTAAKDRGVKKELYQRFGIKEFKDRKISSLSGGQRQRVMIARALCAEPKLLLLDEPTSSIDKEGKRQIYSLLEELNKKMSIILVSHDTAESLNVESRTIYINKSLEYV